MENKKGDKIFMKILMIAHFTNGKDETGNCRFHYLVNLLVQQGYEVELLTSSFCHAKKSQRSQNILYPYKIKYIYEPGYRKNVSIQRIISHRKMGKNLKKYLNNLKEKPDVIYCAVPSLDIAYEAGKYAKEKKIRFLIDVQDLWPEAFEMVFSVPLLNKMLFFPMRRKANKVYCMADEIIAVSETYANRALSVNKKVTKGYSVFLGTELSYFDSLKEEKDKIKDNKFRVAYIGTLGHSYNIKVIIDAIEILYNQGITDLEFLVMGDGPLMEEFQKYAEKRKGNVVFTGRLSYDKMVKKLCTCQVAVNPIVHGAAASIINKVGDYAAAGLPVVNSQECLEYCNLLSRYSAGINCRCDNVEDIVNGIKMLYENKATRDIMAKNSRNLAEKYFNRSISYQMIIEVINQNVIMY